MKSIMGSFCGVFPLPKEPFVSQPFFGEYRATAATSSAYERRGPTARTTDRGAGTDERADGARAVRAPPQDTGGTDVRPRSQYESDVREDAR